MRCLGRRLLPWLSPSGCRCCWTRARFVPPSSVPCAWWRRMFSFRCPHLPGFWAQPYAHDQVGVLGSHWEAILPEDLMLRVVTGAKAQGIRAMALSLRVVASDSWVDLVETAFWYSYVVFVSPYLRGGGSLLRGGTWRLRPPGTPVVATQGVVRPLSAPASSEARFTAGTTPLRVSQGAFGLKVCGEVFHADAFLVLAPFCLVS